MKAVILAAGVGKRLYPLTKDRPKCLLTVGEETVLEHQLRNIREAGIKEAVVIAGAFREKVEDVLRRDNYGVNIQLVYNPIYDISNNLVSLWYAREHLKGGFILLNGDVVFYADVLRLLLAKDNENSIFLSTSTKNQYDEDDMKVELEGERLLQVNKEIPPERTHAESIGIVKFSKGTVDRLIGVMDDIVNNRKLLKAWFLVAIEEMINSGTNVFSVDTSNYPWVEIDYPKDLDEARSIIIERIKNNRRCLSQ